ncbi:MAG: caspase family protein [Deltaproteobacteria bacterium]|nr:caspase family protein [Deltaproteobacteria bacterium]
MIRSTKCAGSALIAVLVMLGASSFARAGTQRFAVVLGNNVGQQTDAALRFAERDAIKFAAVLRELGGFAAQDVELLLGADAATAWKAIRRTARRATAASHAGEKTVLLVYYSGHADGGALELGRSRLDLRDLSKFLEEKTATVRLAFVDSCRSGAIVRFKGGRRGPAYQIQLAEDLNASGYAIVTSSAHDELSQETSEVGGSFFSHFLVSGLRGGADSSGDGSVTLGELYDYAYRRTVARTSASIAGVQHPSYSLNLAGRGDVVLSRPSASRTRISLRVDRGGRVLVLDQDQRQLITERALKGGETVEVPLPPERYAVFLVANDRTIWRAWAVVRPNQTRQLTQTDFSRHHPRLAIAKGGLFRRSVVRAQEIAIGATVRRSALDAEGAQLGLEIGYSMVLSSGLALSAAIDWARSARTPSAAIHEIGILAGIGWRFAVTPQTHLTLQARAGYEHLIQTTGQQSPGVCYHGRLTIGYRLRSALFVQLDGLFGGRTLTLEQGQLLTRADARGGLALALRFGE